MIWCEEDKESYLIYQDKELIAKIDKKNKKIKPYGGWKVKKYIINHNVKGDKVKRKLDNLENWLKRGIKKDEAIISLYNDELMEN